MSRDDDVHLAMNALRRIVRALRVTAPEAEHGVSVAQLFVLRLLAGEGPQSIRSLAQLTLTDPSSVSVVVRKLAERGLVSRTTSKADSRRAEVRLTPRGQALARRAPEAPQARLLEALALLPLRRLRLLAASLDELAGRMGAGSPALFFEDEPRPVRRSSRR